MKRSVTKEQYEFFRSLYDDETRSTLQLEGRAKVYLGVITVFLAAILLKARDSHDVADALHIPWPLLLLEALAMTFALGLVLWALRVRRFEAVSEGIRLLTLYEPEWPEEEQFYEDRAVDYAFASSYNRKLNSDTTQILALASWLTIGSIIMVFAAVAYAVWRA